MKCFAFLILLLFSGRSVVFCQSGPAGVGISSNLSFWLDANAADFNTPVDAWPDVSGNNVTTMINGNPMFTPSVLNGRGVVRFDGDGDEVQTDFSINAFDYDQLTVICVYVPLVDHAGSVWGEDNGAWDRFLTDITIVDQLNSAVGAGYDPEYTTHPSSNIPNLFLTNVATLSTVVYDDDLFLGTYVYVNGEYERSFTSNAADYYYAFDGNGYSNFYVGAIGTGANGSNGFRFNGDIAEVIVFRNDITLTQRILVENYLAAKYGIGLPSSIDLYDEDDSGYDFNVAGIGNLNGSLQQDSRGTGIVRMWNPSHLDDTEFLLWGDDNGMLQATNVTDIPGGVQARSNRIWRVSEVNTSRTPIDAGTVNLSFTIVNLGPVNVNDLRLLIDTDNDGAFADESPISGAVALGSNEYAFNAVSTISNNVRFTIGTSNSLQTPLPVELISFDAEASFENVALTWRTALEKNVKHFSVSRSKNGLDWLDLATIKATEANAYGFIDHSALDGRSYYKLTTEDFNATKKTLAIRSVMRDEAKQLMAYPNPFKAAVTVNVPYSKDVNISVVNSNGIDCTSAVKFEIKNNTEIELDLADLPDGPYLIHMKDHSSIHLLKTAN